MSWSFDSLTAYYTTDKRPAFRLASRPYRIGYNALVVACGRRLVLLRLNSRLPPFLVSVQARLIRIQLLRFKLSTIQHKTKSPFALSVNLARMSVK